MNIKRSRITLKPDFITYLLSKKIYFFAFLIPAVIILVAYFSFGVYPVGDESALVLDLNGQYVYYFENLRDAFWGNGSLLNSWSRNLSGETVGIFAYYLASPFTLIVMLLPRSMMASSILIMQLCKAGTAGAIFCYFLHKHKRYTVSSSLIFSILYAVMSYMIVQLMDPMWLDALVYLPLIIIGIEKLIDEAKLLNFIIPLTLMFIANFYIGWMIAIFCCVYFLVYYFAFSEAQDKFKFGDFVYSGSQFVVGGALSAMCSAFILVPLYYSLSLGKFEFTDPNFALETQFDFADFFINMLPNVYDTCRPEGSPVIYCGVITVILLPLFMLNTNIKLKTKIGYGILFLTLVLSMYLSTVDMVWHGFQVPNWLPYRYSFLVSFVMIMMAVQAFERIEGISFKEIGLMFFLLCGYVFYLDKQDIERVDITVTVWYTVLMTAIYCLLLYLHKKNHTAKPASVVLIMFIIAELVLSSTFTIYDIDADVVYSNYSSYNRYITLGRNTVEKIYEMDDEPVYRIESHHHRTVNDPMAFGSYGISHSSSTLNEAPIEFLRQLGFSYGGHYIKYQGDTYISDAILGIKYVMEKGDAAPAEGMDVIEVEESIHYDGNMVLANGDSKDILYVYENPNVLPIGFMVSDDILDVKLTGDNPFESQNMLFASMVNDTKAEYFQPIEVDDVIPENAKASKYGDHDKYVPRIEGENSHIEFIIKAPTEDMIYFYAPSSYERKVNLWLNEEFMGYYFEGGNKTIRALGDYEIGEEISLITTITEEKNEVLFKEQYFYYLDEELFQKSIDELREEPLVIEEFSESKIKGNVTADKDGILYTSIAWEPGWTIKVDGEKVEPVKLVDALIGIPVTAGEHTVTMSFFPKGLGLGILISVAGLVIVVLIAISERKKKGILLEKLYE